MDSASMNEITVTLDTKLRRIKLALSMSQADEKTVREANDILKSISDEMVECREAIAELTECTASKHEQAKALKNLTNEVKQMDVHISQALENLLLPNEDQSLPPPSDSNRTDSSTTLQLSSSSGECSLPHPQAPTKKNSGFPQIIHLNQEEYETIPKYMKNRIPMKMMNDAVDDLNKTITVKYALLSKSTSSLSISEMKQYRLYKSQEIPETKGTYFCVAEDLKKNTAFKLDNTGKNILISLRHCHRIREIRTSSLIRYVFIV